MFKNFFKWVLSNLFSTRTNSIRVVITDNDRIVPAYDKLEDCFEAEEDPALMRVIFNQAICHLIANDVYDFEIGEFIVEYEIDWQLHVKCGQIRKVEDKISK